MLNPNPLATLIMPLPAGNLHRRQLESVFIAVLSNAVADNDQRIADRARDGQNFEIRLRKIAEIVEIVHFVLNKKERVLGIIGGSRGTDDHAGGISSVPGNAVGGAGISAECS